MSSHDTSSEENILWSDKDWAAIDESASLPDGRVKKAVRIRRADSAHLIAFKTEEAILVLREFRPYYGTYIWMLPSGRVDKEKDVLAAAQRELQEETGFRAEKLEYYCTTNYSESLIAANHIFIAKNLKPDPLPQDSDELIEVHELTVEDALEKILTSEKVHTASAFALLRYLRENKAA